MNRGARAARPCVSQCARRGSQWGTSTRQPAGALATGQGGMYPCVKDVFSASSMITHALVVVAPYCERQLATPPHRQPAQTVALTARERRAHSEGERERGECRGRGRTRARARLHCREARARHTRQEPLSLSRRGCAGPQRKRACADTQHAQVGKAAAGTHAAPSDGEKHDFLMPPFSRMRPPREPLDVWCGTAHACGGKGGGRRVESVTAGG